jgi:hypothetical protein
VEASERKRTGRELEEKKRNERKVNEKWKRNGREGHQR